MTPEWPVLISPTLDLVHAERAWLYAVSLLGGFMFEERASMVKRHWTGGVSDAWKLGVAHQITVASVMAFYVDDFVREPCIRRGLNLNIHINMLRLANYIECSKGFGPRFDVRVAME
jgi:hypothetical protein